MKKPNIVYIFSDQHRMHAMGFWDESQFAKHLSTVGDPVITPHMDQFARESIVFTQASCVYPICSPARAMLLSGRYPSKNGVYDNCKAGRNCELKEDITCLTDVLSKNGYHIGYIGKYHLDMPRPHFDREGNYTVESGSFYADGSSADETKCWDMITPAGSKRHGTHFWYAYNTFDVHKNPHYWTNDGTKIEPKEWSPKHEADVAIDYIINTNDTRDKDTPYCLFVSMNPPHTPYNCKEDTDEEMLEQFYTKDKIKDANSLLVRENCDKGVVKENWIRYYFSHVSGIDRQFGRILQAIDESGERENTIVVYSADHGEMMGSHGLMHKTVPYDEAFLIPLLIRYPKMLNNRVENRLISMPDIMPTLLGLINLQEEIPDDVDGLDFSAYLINPLETENQVTHRNSALYMGKGLRGIRTERYTFVIADENGEAVISHLFDNKKDPYQENQLIFHKLDKKLQHELLMELGYQLKLANDSWYQNKTFSSLIVY